MTVAALYIDAHRGPYPSLPDVDCWGIERDATRYAGPWPVVAHPPCGAWGCLHWIYKGQDRHIGPLAVAQVRRWGGVLEHPAHSGLWNACGLPRPGWLPDAWGGFTIELNQCDFGHKAAKATWLYVVGCRQSSLPALPPAGRATHMIGGRYGVRSGGMPPLPKSLRHLTPPAFAAWLVEVANRCHARGVA